MWIMCSRGNNHVETVESVCCVFRYKKHIELWANFVFFCFEFWFLDHTQQYSGFISGFACSNHSWRYLEEPYRCQRSNLGQAHKAEGSNPYEPMLRKQNNQHKPANQSKTGERGKNISRKVILMREGICSCVGTIEIY